MSGAPNLAEDELGGAVRALDALAQRLDDLDLGHGLEEERAAFDAARETIRAIADAERVAFRVVEEGVSPQGIPAYVLEASKKLPPIFGAFVVPIEAAPRPRIVKA